MKVSFFCDKHMHGAIPAPIPAVKAVPPYYKSIKPQINENPASGTVKRCIPFLEALSHGFIIKMWADVYVLTKDGNLTIEFSDGFKHDSLGWHSSDQIPNHPLSHTKYGNLPAKWMNPWVIETEPGVSCLFTSPLNHMESRFKILDGVVDTDSYYNKINFPFLWTGGDGSFFIEKGTPLVQVIPFRREENSISVGEIDLDRIKRLDSQLGTKIKNAYKDELWHKRKQSSSEDEDYISSVGETVKIDQQEKIVEQKINSSSEELHENGYVFIPNLISADLANNLADKIREYVERNGSQEDIMCPSSKSVAGTPFLDELLDNLTSDISAAAGKNLLPTYSYARIYSKGDTLPKHTDRPSCQYSVTLCLAMSGSPWPIFMAPQADENTGQQYDKFGHEGTFYMGEPKSLSANVGDAVLYLGNDMVHYREALTDEWQIQVFLHWVDADGEYAHFKYDGRPSLAHKENKTLESVKVEDLASASNLKQISSSGILEVSADDEGRGFGKGPY